MSDVCFETLGTPPPPPPLPPQTPARPHRISDFLPCLAPDCDVPSGRAAGMHLSPGVISRCLPNGPCSATPEGFPRTIGGGPATPLDTLFRTAMGSPPSSQRAAHRLHGARSPLARCLDPAGMSVPASSLLRSIENSSTQPDDAAAAALVEMASPERGDAVWDSNTSWPPQQPHYHPSRPWSPHWLRTAALTLERRKPSPPRVRSVVAPRRLSPGLEIVTSTQGSLRPKDGQATLPKVLLSQVTWKPRTPLTLLGLADPPSASHRRSSRRLAVACRPRRSPSRLRPSPRSAGVTATSRTSAGASRGCTRRPRRPRGPRQRPRLRRGRPPRSGRKAPRRLRRW